MIDGKLTSLSQDQLTTLLRSTDGNSIDNIELMSNPPAKYDASGSAGLINIKLKKNSNLGTNGTLTAGAGYGTFYKTNGAVTLNHRTRHLNIFGNYNYVNAKEFQNVNLTRSTTAGNETTYFNQQGRNITLAKNNSYKAGIDYYINDRNTLGIVFNGYSNRNTTKSFANKKANIKLAANDAFNLMKARVSSMIPSQDYKLIQKQETRVFRLTFSYNFGSSQIKAVREHSSASETEQKE